MRVEGATVHAGHVGRYVARHVAAVLDGLLLLSVCCSKLCLMAGSGRGCIDSVQINCMAASNEGGCQLWGTAKVQMDVAGEHILPGVALGDCLSSGHLCDKAVGDQKILVALNIFHQEGVRLLHKKILVRRNVEACVVAGCSQEVLSNICKQYPGREQVVQGRQIGQQLTVSHPLQTETLIWRCSDLLESMGLHHCQLSML